MQDRASRLYRLDLAEVLKQIERHRAPNPDLVRRLSHLRLDACSVNAATMPGMRP
jgi:hypothetical protein